jgi:hypothetical protein
VRKRSRASGAAAIGLLVAASGALASQASAGQAGGAIDMFVQPAGDGTGKILFSGAIGDAGTTRNVDRDGKPDRNGGYARASLGKGTLLIDKKALDLAGTKVSPKVNGATCSAGFSVSARVTLLDGTGSYKGVSGTIKATEFFGFVVARSTSGSTRGRCDLNGPVRSALGVIVGTGTVSFG